ncbi:hypothetical protein [Accumulibacter sp.]|uniref:hypothetical protein n=1 Tax=Accumulibacter sp. TaxID=2053492 RepID=UPI0026283765|nr:hypothetical protein [Accumulibacter sp.]
MDRPHLFVDISAHGFGHLAQVAPVLEALGKRLPALRLSIRSGLPTAKLRARVAADFSHLPGSSDFGYVMHDAVSLDLDATAQAYRRQHADWNRLVESDAQLFRQLKPNLVLSDVAYLPLAGAARAGIPAVAMCSLNWAELFAHFFASEDWAPTIHRQMLEAYRSAECFLRLTPGMAMSDLPGLRTIGPIAAVGGDCRQELRRQLGCSGEQRLVLIAFGGVEKQLPVDQWPPLAGLHWLIPQAWQIDQPGFTDFEALGRPITDLMRAVDAVLTKPGYGTFAEAACNGTPLLYLRREDWPEQDVLIAWLQQHGRCREVSDADLLAGRLRPALAALWSQAPPAVPRPSGADEAAAALLPWLATAGKA